MAKQPKSRDDRRSRKDLELFILALVRDGLSTPYDLMAARISPGASIRRQFELSARSAELEEAGSKPIGSQTAASFFACRRK